MGGQVKARQGLAKHLRSKHWRAGKGKARQSSVEHGKVNVKLAEEGEIRLSI